METWGEAKRPLALADCRKRSLEFNDQQAVLPIGRTALGHQPNGNWVTKRLSAAGPSVSIAAICVAWRLVREKGGQASPARRERSALEM